MAAGTAVLILAPAGLGGDGGKCSRGPTGATAAADSRLVPFRSCGDLLGYVKSQAAPLVGPWGFGGRAVPRRRCRPASSLRRRRRRTDDARRPQGVDYSGHERPGAGRRRAGHRSRRTARRCSPSRTAGSTRSTSAAQRPRLLDSLKLDGGWSHELLLHGDRLLVLSRGGYWADAAARADGAR